MDVDTGMGAGASDEPIAANDPEFDEEDDEAMMRNSVEAHVKTAATRLSLIRAPCPPYDVQMGSLAARFGHVLTADQERRRGWRRGARSCPRRRSQPPPPPCAGASRASSSA